MVRQTLALSALAFTVACGCSDDSFPEDGGNADARIDGRAVDLPSADAGGLSPIATVPLGQGPDAIFGTASYIYAANVGANTISIVDRATNQVTKTLVVKQGPWTFAKLPGAAVAITSNAGQIDIIDTTTNTITKTFALPFKASGIVASSDGSKLFVLAVDDNELHVLSATDGAELAKYGTGQGPDNIAMSPDGSAVFISNTGEGTIQILDTATGAELKRHAVGDKPELIHRSHDGSKVFISNFFANKVHIVDTATYEIIGEISGLNGPEEAVSNDDDSLLFVANFETDVVRIFRLADHTEVGPTLSTGDKPIGVWVAGQRVYVTNHGDGTLGVYDLP